MKRGRGSGRPKREALLTDGGSKVLFKFMKPSLHLAVVAFVLTVASAAAQSSLNGAKLNIASIDLAGASSLHRLVTAVDTNNAITASGTRYDTASGEVSFSPAEGTAVASLDGSGFGVPVSTTNTITINKVLRNPRTRTNVTVTLTNTAVTTVAPFGIFLDDGSQIKGSLTSVSCLRQEARLSSAGIPIFTTRPGGESRTKLDGVIALGEKTGNFSGGNESEQH